MTLGCLKGKSCQVGRCLIEFPLNQPNNWFSVTQRHTHGLGIGKTQDRVGLPRAFWGFPKGGDLLSETLISSHTRMRIHHEDPASIPSFSKTKRFSLGIELDYVTCFLGNGSGRFGRSPIKRRSCTFWGNTPLPLIQEDDYSGVNMFSVATKYVDPSSSRNSPTAGDKKHYTQLAGGDSLMGGGSPAKVMYYN